MYHMQQVDEILQVSKHRQLALISSMPSACPFSISQPSALGTVLRVTSWGTSVGAVIDKAPNDSPTNNTTVL